MGAKGKKKTQRLVEDITAVIRMSSDDDSIENALTTCYDAKFHQGKETIFFPEKFLTKQSPQ